MQGTVFDEDELEQVGTLLLCHRPWELCKDQIGLTGRNIVGPYNWRPGIFVDTRPYSEMEEGIHDVDCWKPVWCLYKFGGSREICQVESVGPDVEVEYAQV